MTIDWWTLGLQAVNVVVLVWLLAAVFLAPGRGHDRAAPRRRRSSSGRCASASAARRRPRCAEIERTRAGFAQEREAILAAAHEAAEAGQAARLAEAAQEAAAL